LVEALPVLENECYFTSVSCDQGGVKFCVLACIYKDSKYPVAAAENTQVFLSPNFKIWEGKTVGKAESLSKV
jgi:hypothetical protein